MVKFQLSGTQVRAFTFLLACILALCVFAVLPVDITYLDYVGSLSLILQLVLTHVKIVMQRMKTI